MWFRSLLLAAAVLATSAPPALADKGGRHNGGYMQPEFAFQQRGRGDDARQESRPLREVVEELQRQYGGELISARRSEDGQSYVIRWRMPNGDVRDFRVSAVR